MKTYFARGVLALLWYFLWAGIVWALMSIPSPSSTCKPDEGIGGILFIAWIFATSAGLTIYAIIRAIGWLFDSAFFQD